MNSSMLSNIMRYGCHLETASIAKLINTSLSDQQIYL